MNEVPSNDVWFQKHMIDAVSEIRKEVHYIRGKVDILSRKNLEFAGRISAVEVRAGLLGALAGGIIVSGTFLFKSLFGF